MLKQLFLRIYTCTVSSPQKANTFQKRARDLEWDAIKDYISKGKFIDIGAGAGYAMLRAHNDFGCQVCGIDPQPGEHGVGRTGSEYAIPLEVKQAYAENVPYPDKSFDTVYSSHVLEHVTDLNKALHEMTRLVTQQGTIIIGVPTSTMATINLLSQWLLTTHIRIGNALFFLLLKTERAPLWTIFLPISHSHSTKSVFWDIKHYAIKRWTKQIETHCTIEHIILPGLYPYPDYIQLFKLRKSKKYSSSVFYICKIKTQNIS